MFLVGQNVFYGGGFAGLAYLDYGNAGMAKAVEHSYAYQKCIKTDAKSTTVSDSNKKQDNGI